jgi:hypothetical protein
MANVYTFAFEVDVALAQIMIYLKNWLDDERVVIALEFNIP